MTLTCATTGKLLKVKDVRIVDVWEEVIDGIKRLTRVFTARKHYDVVESFDYITTKLKEQE